MVPILLLCPTPSERGQRKTIPVDKDAFFAAVEQRDDAALREASVALAGGVFPLTLVSAWSVSRYRI